MRIGCLEFRIGPLAQSACRFHSIPPIQIRGPNRPIHRPFRYFLKVLPGDRDLQRPARVLVSAHVQRAPNIRQKLNAREIEPLQSIARVVHQVVVKHSAGIHFQAIIYAGLGWLRVQENFYRVIEIGWVGALRMDGDDIVVLTVVPPT